MQSEPTRRQRFRWSAVGLVLALVATLIAGIGSSASADGAPPLFRHVGTFDVTQNAGSEVAEIVTSTKDGMTLIYTDSDAEALGFVDLTDPRNPAPAGLLPLAGEPTSVAVHNGWALVAINTSPDFVSPSGSLVVVDIATLTVVTTIDLGGQPDSIAVSPSGLYAAVAIETERDEDLNDGIIPQLPAGTLVIIDLTGAPGGWTTRTVDLTGYAHTAPSDPEPEYVDINDADEAVVSLQENNHLLIVDLPTGTVVADFPAGSVEIDKLDNTEEELGPQENGEIFLTEGPITRRREPDTVTWLGDYRFATANEGDYEDENGEEGGSRSFTIFNKKGEVLHEAGMDFEYTGISAGHYNEGRSENKGSEPESAESAWYGPHHLLFIGSERANFLGVYDATSFGGAPELVQILPTGIGPEGVNAIPNRGLLAVANEVSEGDVPSMIAIYRAVGYDGEETPEYPGLYSANDAMGTPIPWVAMSGLTGSTEWRHTLFGVSDSFLATGYVYKIELIEDRAKGMITMRIPVTDPHGLAGGDHFFPDLEGVAMAPEGGFWLGSEGRVSAGSERPNLIIRTDMDGVVQEAIELPADLVAGATNSGIEGIAAKGKNGVTEFVYVVIQREWADDPANTVKIGRYETATGEWTFVRYPKAAPAGAGWVGLSEITALPDGRFAIIERDNQLGPLATVKQVWGVDLRNADFRPFGSDLVTIDKHLLIDLLPILQDNSVWVPDKVEGLSVSGTGTVHIVTDNDGIDDAIGQTVFERLGFWLTTFGG